MYLYLDMIYVEIIKKNNIFAYSVHQRRKGLVLFSSDVAFVAGLNKLLNKQTSGPWLQTPLRPYDITAMINP